jgi:hypothetical protein
LKKNAGERPIYINIDEDDDSCLYKEEDGFIKNGVS